jgi:K+-transporting ATPase ATPase A chain
MVLMSAICFCRCRDGSRSNGFTAMKERTTDKLGNFYNYFIKSCTRILLPLSALVAIVVISGTPMTLKEKINYHFTRDSVAVSRGPAAFIGIKHIGTNGGGFFWSKFGTSIRESTYFTNAVELWAQLIIPFAMIFALVLSKEKKAVLRSFLEL